VLFDPDTGETRAMRSKEDAHDYRYFPDPDLLPLVIARLDRARAAELPELPAALSARFMGEYGLSAYDATTLTASRDSGRVLPGHRRRRRPAPTPRPAPTG
jgi:aspartyl-tRNA(Asn)/glutamyl-tRNA(Gln) amidotransferase subunit B